MHISTIEVKIKKSKKISVEFIEKELANLSIVPLRWAITRVLVREIVLDVAVIFSN